LKHKDCDEYDHNNGKKKPKAVRTGGSLKIKPLICITDLQNTTVINITNSLGNYITALNLLMLIPLARLEKLIWFGEDQMDMNQQ
jgi:hypothetical protein